MYALNIKKGTVLQHPDLGILEAGVAVYITEDLVPIAKNLRGIVVFDKVAGITEERETKIAKNLYEKNIEELRERVSESEEKLTFQDFIRKYGNAEAAAPKWAKYKQSKGLA